MTPSLSFHSRGLQVIGAAVLVGIILFAALWVPKRVPNECIKVLEFGAGASIAQNCDSANIASTVNSIPAYLTNPSPWRTRPVYIFSVAVLKNILSLVLTPVSNSLFEAFPALKMSPYTLGNAEWLNTYLAAIILNGLVITVSCLLLIRIVGTTDPLVRLGICAIVASFDIAAAWFWVPHQVIMNLLAPIGGVWSFWLGGRVKTFSPLRLLCLGLLAGLASLMYGFCLVWPFLFGLGVLTTMPDHSWRSIRASVQQLTYYGVGFLAPFVLWFGPYAIAGLPLSYEYGLRQFAWFPEALAQGYLGDAFLRQGALFLDVVARYLGTYGLILSVVTFVVWLFVIYKRGARATVADPVIAGATATLVLMLLFNFLQGFYVGRLIMFPILLMLIISLRLLSLIRAKKAQLALCLIVAGLQMALLLSAPAISQE